MDDAHLFGPFFAHRVGSCIGSYGQIDLLLEPVMQLSLLGWAALPSSASGLQSIRLAAAVYRSRAVQLNSNPPDQLLLQGS